MTSSTSPSPVPAGGGGEVLGEEAQAAAEDAYWAAHEAGLPHEDRMRSVFAVLDRHVAALVAQARADGAAEAEEERADLERQNIGLGKTIEVEQRKLRAIQTVHSATGQEGRRRPHILDLTRPCWCGATPVGAARPVDHTPVTPTAQDGEGLADTLVVNIHSLSGHLDACLDDLGRTDVSSLRWLEDYRSENPAQTLAAVAPDIAAQAKRECAEERATELRLLARKIRDECGYTIAALANRLDSGNLYDDPTITSVVRELRSLAAEWSGSGRTPAGEERETVEELNEGDR